MAKGRRETAPDPEFYERAAQELEHIADVMDKRDDVDDSVAKRLREIAEAVRGHP